jgi:hypothetical protein
VATFKRCDECGKNLSGNSGITVTPPSSNIAYCGSGSRVADLCDWQCVGRYAEKRSKDTGAVVTYNNQLLSSALPE